MPLLEEERQELKGFNAMLQIKDKLPVYHTRAMRRAYHQRFSLLTGTSTVLRREMYSFLAADASADTTRGGGAIDERLRLLLDMGGVNITNDLREVRGTSLQSSFSDFWNHADVVVQELFAPHDRRHHNTGYLAGMISIRDFIAQVEAKLPAGTPVPSNEWVR